MRGQRGDRVANRMSHASLFLAAVLTLFYPIQVTASPQDDGQITFTTRDLSGGPRLLWRLQATPGSVPENLTTKLDAIASFPGTHAGPITVSPDGAWYAFQSARFTNSGGATVLTIAPADFSSAETISTPNGIVYNEGMAQVTPGGAAVVYSGNGGSHIRDLFVVRRQGGGWSVPVALTGGSTFSYHSWPVLLRDGTKVVFNASNNDQYGSAGNVVAEVNLDGTGFRVLVAPADGPAGSNSPYCSFPAYTPDGNSVIFEAVWSGSEQVWRRAVSGGVPTQLNSSFVNDNSPTVLPDGRVVSLLEDAYHQIKVMNSDGQNGTLLGTNAAAMFLDVADIGMGTGLLWAPVLTIQTNGNAVQISWPARFTNLTVQGSTTLPAAPLWTSLFTGNSGVTLSITNPAQFFRLVK